MMLSGLNAGTIRKINEFIHLIQKFTNEFATTEAYEMANKIASESGILTELYQDKSPENLSRYENTQELLNAIQDFSINAREEGRPAGLQIFMEDVALLTDQDNDKEGDTDKVTLMTVHSSKGLEFKNVFIVGLEENLFPSGFSGTLTLLELEEERRLFYVALTRSENQAWLSFAQQRLRWGKTEFCNPSRFIGEIDHQFLDIQNIRSLPQFRNQELMADHSNKHLQREEPVYQPPRRPDPPNQRIQTSKSVLPSSSKPFESDNPEKIQVGMFVEHERFGRGKVINIEGKMPDLKAKVFFPNGGEKNLLLKFAKLKILDEKD
jgi:DNA helicase-2/ATP-dependent DNA helicase PcrA